MKTEVEQAGKPLNAKALDAAFKAVKHTRATKDTLALAIITYLNAMRDMSDEERQEQPLRAEQPPRPPQTMTRRPVRNS